MNLDHLITYITTLEPDEGHVFLWTGLHPDGQRLQTYGTLEEMLPKLQQRNAEGYGIFVAVNAIDKPSYDNGYPRRRNSDVTRIRAVFADFDDPNEPVPDMIAPTMVVQTSPGKVHCYWCVEGDFPLADFEVIQRGISQKLGSDPAVHDLARILRVPGFDHTKDLERRTPVELVEHTGLRYTLDDMRKWFPYDATKQRPKFSTWAGEVERRAAQTAAVVAANHFPRIDGGYNVRCPWENEHTTPSSESSTTYWPPAERNNGRGSFVCLHAHCTGRMVDEYDAWISKSVATFLA